MNTSIKIAIGLQVIAILAILFDIPIVRQIVGFIYISFLPGFLILKAFKVNFASIVEDLAFSAGLSIAFSMFTGLAINHLYPLLGIAAPLSVLPILVTISTILLALTLLGSRNQIKSTYSYSLPNVKQFAPFALLATVPFLAVFGALTLSNWALLCMVIVIAALAVISIFYRKNLPAAFFPVAIAVIAISLIFHRELITTNLLGWDTFGEYHVFKLADMNSLWQPYLNFNQSELRDYNAMLSVTVLPTIYSKLMNISGEWIFKSLYFVLYAFVPLAMYEMYKHNFGRATAFLAAFYFITFPRFFGEERRQIIGELFLVLILFTILSSSINFKKKEPLIAIFGIALIVSHYSTFYVFMFCALFAWIALILMEKLSIIKKPLEIKKVLTARVLLILLAVGVFWYVFISTSLDQTFIAFIDRLSLSFTSGFVDVGSRGGTVSEFISPNFANMTITGQIDYFVSKIPYLLIAVGTVALIKNRKKMNIQAEYLPITVAAIAILLMTFILPALADSFIEARFFHLLLIFLAPISFYGGIVAFTWIAKHYTSINRARSYAICTLCILFVAIFMFKVGFVNEISGDLGSGVSSSMSFNQITKSNNPQVLANFYEGYVPNEDVYSAKWLSSEIPLNATLYADITSSQRVLRGYALRVIDWENMLTNNTRIKDDAYVYLRTFNVQGYFIDVYGGMFNMTQISNQLEDTNKIYSNSKSEIYYSG
jgi:uncharacterized membrane protein